MSCIKIKTAAIVASKRAFLSSLVVLLIVIAGTAWAQAQTYEVLYTFTGGADGSGPLAGLVRDAEGNLYGTTTYGGGNYDGGVVFKLNPTEKLTILHTFTGGADGANPRGDLIRDGKGNLYGTAENGGIHKGGVVFKMSPTGKLTTLHAFGTGGGGSLPLAGLVRDALGNLYGTTIYGGDLNCYPGAGCGVVFKVDTDGKETVLHRFTGGADGGFPDADLILDAAGDLYGTTVNGGADGYGVVFKLNPTTRKETVLYSFSGGPDGGDPVSRLVLGPAGDLYGTTAGGGEINCWPPSGCGVVFKLDTNGKETVLHTFTGVVGGIGPNAGVLRDDAGNLYGTTVDGGGDANCENGYAGCGVVFKLDTNGKEAVLYRFTGGADGARPFAGLIRDAKGNLYGTAYESGDLNCPGSDGPGCGVVFKVTP